MSSMKSFDLIVMGGGMTGLAAAVFAAQQGFDVALLEKNEVSAKPIEAKTAGNYAPRVSAITPCSQQFLAHLNAWSAVLMQRCSAYQSMQVWESQGAGQICFQATEVGVRELGFIIENDVIVNALFEQLQALDVSVYSGVSALSLNVTADRAQLELASGQQLSAQLIIGADGAQSWVRQQLAWPTVSRDYKQRALVATVRTERSHQRTAWQRFLPTGPLAFLPLDDVHYSSIVWSLNEDCIESVLNLDDLRFKSELKRAFAGRLGDIMDVSRRFAFALHAEHACGYARPRVALVGDAAHRIHPLAGQGINLGFLDVMALIDVLVQMRQKKRDLGHMMTVQKYERLRYGHNALTSAAMTGFKELFSVQSEPWLRLRTIGLQLADKNSFIKRRLIRQAMGLQTGQRYGLPAALEQV